MRQITHALWAKGQTLPFDIEKLSIMTRTSFDDFKIILSLTQENVSVSAQHAPFIS